MIQTQYEISTFFVKSVKGGLILESFSRFLKSPQKGAKNFSLHYPQIEEAKDRDGYFFGEIESEKLSEVKPPLLH